MAHSPSTQLDVEQFIHRSGMVAVTRSNRKAADPSLRELANLLRDHDADAITRALVRDGAEHILREAGVEAQAAAEAIDAAVGVVQGQSALFADADDEPWPGAVGATLLLNEMADYIRRYVVIPDYAVHAVALWIVLAHAAAAATVLPLLALLSPTKRCGKTKCVDVITPLLPRALATSNISVAAVYRVIQKSTPTLLMDEADTYMDDQDGLRGILNSGHTKTAAFVVRNVRNGDDWEPRKFSTWCPKVISRIGKLPDTLADRSITVRMDRKKAGEHVEAFRQDRTDQAASVLRRMAAKWASDNLERLRDHEPTIPEGLDDRARDNWRLMLAIAELADVEQGYEAGDRSEPFNPIGFTGWAARGRAAAQAMSGLRADGESAEMGVQLLRDVARVIRASGKDKLPSKTILEELSKLPESRWNEWAGKNNPLSERQLASNLKRFGVRSTGFRSGHQVLRGYTLESLEGPLARYAPPSPPEDPLRGSAGELNSLMGEDVTCSGSASATGPLQGASATATGPAGASIAATREMGAPGPPLAPHVTPHGVGQPSPTQLLDLEAQARKNLAKRRARSLPGMRE